jgi:hypothetical protein
LYLHLIKKRLLANQFSLFFSLPFPWVMHSVNQMCVKLAGDWEERKA